MIIIWTTQIFFFFIFPESFFPVNFSVAEAVRDVHGRVQDQPSRPQHDDLNTFAHSPIDSKSFWPPFKTISKLFKL